MEYINLFLYKKQLDIDEELIKSELISKLQKKKEIDEFNLSEIVIETFQKSKLVNRKKYSNKLDLKKLHHYIVVLVSSAKGGLIGWIASKSISPIIFKRNNKIRKRQISDPIEINNNIVIIKLNDKRITNQKLFKSCKN